MANEKSLLDVSLQNWLDRTPKPSTDSLANGGAWSRTDYRRQVDARVHIRREILMQESGMERGDFELTCRLVDNPELWERLMAIATDLRLEEIRRKWSEIEREENLELDALAQRCQSCGGDGAVPRLDAPGFRVWCQPCTDEWFSRPSTPPINGLRSALTRARAAHLPATLTVEQWDETVAFFNDRCAFCGGAWCLVEHATPIALGGGTTVDNCLPACNSCNVSKGRRMPEHMGGEKAKAALAWLRSKGRS